MLDTTNRPSRWLAALDTGGTFTDIVARDPSGKLHRVKVPSDGSISATVVRVVPGGIEASFAAGVEPPDGFLEGWQVERWQVEGRSPASRLHAPDLAGHCGTERSTVAVHRGATLTIDGPGRHAIAQLTPGTPLRLVLPHSKGAGNHACGTTLDDARGRASAPRADAPRIGLHLLTRTRLDEQLPNIEIRLSTTRGTNALLEGKGAKVGVLVSDGIAGVVDIGDQTRSALFARVPAPRRKFAHAVQELPERTLADGTADRRATIDEIAAAADALRKAGCETIVVSLAHSLADGGRERGVAAALRGHACPVRAASEVAPHPRLLTRTDTATVAARIAPVLHAFVDDALASAPRDAPAFVFTSAGVLQRAAAFEPRDTLFSGPAGGAAALAGLARRHRLRRAVGLDMGGTSADVARIEDGRIALRPTTMLAGATVAAPALAIDSIAAGGGSICSRRDGACEVGPESAGSAPGPACYGRGGPLALSDINLLAGRLLPGFGALALDARAAERALDALAEVTPGTDGAAMVEARERLIAAFLDIADARMALAIENLCVRDGIDPRGEEGSGDTAHALVAFGGAGGQHGCAIAERLGLTEVVFPHAAGFLCARGVLSASPARMATRPVLAPLDSAYDALRRARDDAERDAREALARDGFASPGGVPDTVRCTSTAALRLAGQEASIEVGFAAEESMRADFDARFLRLYGYAPPRRGIEIESVRVEATVDSSAEAEESPPHPASAGSTPAPVPVARTRLLSRGAWTNADVYLRGALAAGTTLAGPAVVVDAGDTVVLDAGWVARVDPSGDLVARTDAGPAPRPSSAESELFAARLESIALGMGQLLERTALSPNIRDRLDFSCAVLDAHGTLVQNAPHLPVHLGALGACTRLVAAELPLHEGDIAVTNHPAFGGSHLPDVTTVAPVFAGGERVAFVAVRAHHAEIGGTRPGSFPPDARSLEEEGVVLAPFHAVRGGHFDRAGCRQRFASGPYPSRNPDENLADLEAQVAATRHGVREVARLARELGGRFAERCAGELTRADRAMRRAIARLPDGERRASVFLDDGSQICASAIRIPSATGACGDRLRISFAGSAPTHPRNFNAPLAVTRAATLYALRLLIDEPVPMNEGLLRSVDLEIPEGMLHPPFARDPARCPPVVAGNVETSQSVVAALIAVFGLSAESQSTMNNTLFGNDRFTVYETVGGGAGAGPGARGASGVHVHMSNTRLTDIDVLERRAPVVIRRFRLREGSGGDGRWQGGDGIVREYEFREPVTLSFFGSRRAHAPRGSDGGADGAPGGERVVVAGALQTLAGGLHAMDLARDDRFTVETPGGGGWGPPSTGR